MKKFMVLSLCLIMVSSFAGCGGHSYFDTWSADPTQHWHDCMDCSDEQDRGNHELNEEGCCTVCGSHVYENIDGSFTVMTYDSYDSVVANLEYDEDGEIMFFQRFENAYDEDGNPKSVKEYNYNVAVDEPGTERLVMEKEFLPCENPANGVVYCATEIHYDEFGKTVTTNNEEGLPVSMVFYDTEDKVFEEYQYDDEGNVIE